MGDHTGPNQTPLATSLIGHLLCRAAFILFHSDGGLGLLTSLFITEPITDVLYNLVMSAYKQG